MEAEVLGVRGHSQVHSELKVKSRQHVGPVSHHKSVRFHAWLTRLESHPSTQKAEDPGFQASLGYTVRPCLKEQKTKMQMTKETLLIGL